jgi:ATP-binding protein involved in chromosome partitioning
MLNKDAVMKALDGVEDPELRKPLTDLGMVKSVDIDDGQVTVGITLTVPGCPLKHKISEDVKAAVSGLDGVKSVDVQYDVMSDEQRAQLRHKLGHGRPGSQSPEKTYDFAKRFICISSGKGGVGKSTVTANLASALAEMGHKVGVLDADVYGFSMPRMLGVTGKPTIIDDKIVPLRQGNLQVVSVGFFTPEDEPVVWRGPLLHKAINQFLGDSMWDNLDFLLLDLPPGTGDVSITIAQALPTAEMLVVTTPQIAATNVAGRVAKLAETTKLKVIGVVQNMAYYETANGRDYIFGKDGGKDLATKLGVPLLGEIPISTAIREGSDEGKPVALNGADDMGQRFRSIAQALVDMSD